METLQFFENSFGDRYLYDVNRGVFNQLGAANVYQGRFGEALFDNDALTIIIGTDSGLLPRYVQERGPAEGSHYLFLELKELLPTIEQTLEDLAPDEGIHLVDQHGLIDSLRAVRFSDYANLGNVRLIESLAATDAFMPQYREAVAEIRQQFDSLMWIHNVQLSNPTFVTRQLQNLIEHHDAAGSLRDSFAGATAILLGGGPSLDEILPWLAERQQSLLIVAVSRVSRRLREAGVTPHIVVSIDPTELSFDISKEFLELDPRVVLVHANHAAYPLVAQWRGRSAFLDRRYPWTTKHEPENIEAQGPTVTNTAFSLIAAMGCHTILFAGIDLCRSSEGYTHARGSNEFEIGPMLGSAGMRVPTNGGRSAETTPDFYNAIDAFGRQVKALCARGVHVINPAAGAAVIDGVDYVPLEELTVESSDVAPFARLHQALGEDSPQRRLHNYRAMRAELARIHGRLRRIVDLSDEALRCNDGLFGRRGRKADYRNKARMDKIERILDGRFADISGIVRMFSARAFLHMPPTDREWTDDEIEQAGITYYTAYRDNARQVIQLIEQAQTRIAAAIAEDSEPPDYALMLAQWERDNIPGRAAVWLYRHRQAAAALPSQIAARFGELDAAYREVLAQRDTVHLRKMRQEAALGPVRGKLLFLFKEKSEQELRNLVEQLHKQPGSEAAELSCLGEGYLAELDDQAEAAFEHYATVIDLVRDDIADNNDAAVNPRLEDALKRMVMIAMTLNWGDRALLVLQTLADLSPAYQPQFAELLRLMGDAETAADVYTRYLTNVPNDLSSMLKLGKLYRSMGALDAARTAFTYVLQSDPDNKAARTLLDQLESAA